MNLEVARKYSLLDEEARRMRARELAASASSSGVEVDERSNTEGADIIWALLRVQVLRNWTHLLVIFGATRLGFASPTTLYLYFLCIEENYMFPLLGVG